MLLKKRPVCSLASIASSRAVIASAVFMSIKLLTSSDIFENAVDINSTDCASRSSSLAFSSMV